MAAALSAESWGGPERDIPLKDTTLVVELLHAALSDPGRQRRANEDRCLIDPSAGLFLVADGMADNVSPQLVVDWLPGLLRAALPDDAPLDDPQAPDRFREVLGRLSDRIRAESLRRDDMLGTTLALVLVRNGLALVAHLGDSRVYLCREGRLEALTRDHSHVQTLIDAGVLEKETAALRRWNGGPTRYLGMAHTPEPDVRLLNVLACDRLLMCSDGLTGELDDETIRTVLCAPGTPPQACRELIDRANAAGGHDNVTVVVIAAAGSKGSVG
jgi:protein phosphatase